jgi:dTDP-glucose 4,6-dehydratase
MRTVITGGAGFIGSHLCERLVSEGHEVVCVDSLITGSRENLAAVEDSPLFTFVQSDVSESLGVDGAFDRLLHLASPASPIHYLKYPIETLRAGSLGTFNCLTAARECGATFLLTSTSEVYGNPAISPQPESYWGNVNPIGVRSVYDESKRFAEAATMAYRREHGVDTKIVRIFNTYGPRMRSYDGRVVPAFINQALAGEDLTVFGDGSQTRSFCFVSDMVEGLCRMLDGNDEGPVNLGNPAEITVLQLAEEIIALTGSTSGITHKPLPDDDPELRRPDLTRAKKSLGWEPTVDREEGLKLTIDFFRNTA